MNSLLPLSLLLLSLVTPLQQQLRLGLEQLTDSRAELIDRVVLGPQDSLSLDYSLLVHEKSLSWVLRDQYTPESYVQTDRQYGVRMRVYSAASYHYLSHYQHWCSPAARTSALMDHPLSLTTSSSIGSLSLKAQGEVFIILLHCDPNSLDLFARHAIIVGSLSRMTTYGHSSISEQGLLSFVIVIPVYLIMVVYNTWFMKQQETTQWLLICLQTSIVLEIVQQCCSFVVWFIVFYWGWLCCWLRAMNIVLWLCCHHSLLWTILIIHWGYFTIQPVQDYSDSALLFGLQLMIGCLMSAVEPIVYGDGPLMLHDWHSIGSWLACIPTAIVLLHLIYYYYSLAPLRIKFIQRKFFLRALYLAIAHTLFLPCLKLILLLCEPQSCLFLEKSLVSIWHLVVILVGEVQLASTKSVFYQISVYAQTLPMKIH